MCCKPNLNNSNFFPRRCFHQFMLVLNLISLFFLATIMISSSEPRVILIFDINPAKFDANDYFWWKRCSMGLSNAIFPFICERCSRFFYMAILLLGLAGWYQYFILPFYNQFELILFLLFLGGQSSRACWVDWWTLYERRCSWRIHRCWRSLQFYF